MSLRDYLRKRRTTASVAKERLQIIISHERKKHAPDYLPKLQEEILKVIAKYIRIDKDQVNVNLERMGDNAVLELNVTVPENALEHTEEN